MTTPTRTGMFHVARICGGAIGVLLLASGCATRGNIEVLESQLRTQETLIRRYERDMAQLRNELLVSQRELDLVRSELADLGNKVAEEEAVHSLARTDGLAFNTLLTAAQDRDGDSVDECFHANFYPHDAHGELVKLVGRLEIEAIDLARPPAERTIGRWEYSPEESRELWHAGFLSSGFQVDLPWQEPPLGSKVLLLARLTARDGRRFEATHTLHVRAGAAEYAQASRGAPSLEAILQTTHELESLDLPVPDPGLPAAARTGLPTDGHPLSEALSNKVDPFAQRSLREAQPERGHSSAVAPESAESPRPFPGGLPTSDRWTEETIPAWR